MPRLSQQQLETHLLSAAGILRGRTAGQDYKTYILTLMFFKRLCDQWDHEAEAKIRELEAGAGYSFTEEMRQALRADAAIHRFAIPPGCHWRDVADKSQDIGAALNAATRGDDANGIPGIARANSELRGVFTVDWNQPAPDGSGSLISNAVIHNLVQHFDKINLSSASVPNDVLGRAYEYLIKYFADDAGSKAGEFFTPPEVVDILIRILQPQPGEVVYDPTCGSGGMLIHSADYLAESGHPATALRYKGQEMNWQNYAIARINAILHGIEADIHGGKSTLTDPAFLAPDGQGVAQSDVVIANFPFSDEFWWLPEDKRTDDDKKKAKKDAAKARYKDPYGRLSFGNPPMSNGDYAFVQHILASARDPEPGVKGGRCGVVCPQGVLFRGQPAVNEETGEFDKDGNPKFRTRKPDDEYLIRSGLLKAGVVEAVIGLPLNLFYGAGVPACLLILNKSRPAERRERVLFVYAARHFRALSNKNQLRPQDVMRILVHVHAYGDAAKASDLVVSHAARLHGVVDGDKREDIERVRAEFEEWQGKYLQLESEVCALDERIADEQANGARKSVLADLEKTRARHAKSMEGPRKKLRERDEKIAEIQKRAAEDRAAIARTGDELRALYADPAELAKHARVVEMSEIAENEHNLNIPRYVDTFEPEKTIDVGATLKQLQGAEKARGEAEKYLRQVLAEVGFED